MSYTTIQQANREAAKLSAKRNPSASDMMLRDYFAAMAMQAYCSDESYRKTCGQEDTAISAYQMADAMLKAREQ